MKIFNMLLVIFSGLLVMSQSIAEEKLDAKSLEEKLNNVQPGGLSDNNLFNRRKTNTAPPIALTNIKITVTQQPEITSIVRKYKKTDKGIKYIHEEYKINSRLEARKYKKGKSTFIKVNFRSFRPVVLSGKRQVYLVIGNKYDLGYSDIRYSLKGLPRKITYKDEAQLTKSNGQTRLFLIDKNQIHKASIEFDGQRYPLSDYFK